MVYTNYNNFLNAVSTSGELLQYGSKRFRNTRALVLAAVNNSGGALCYASRRLCSDREVVLAAVKNDSHALAFARGAAQSDKEIALAAVSKNGRALMHVRAQTYEIALAAVSNDGCSLIHVCHDLIDKDLVLAAVSNDGFALRFVKQYKFGYDVVFAAISNNPEAIVYVDNLMIDERIAMLCVKCEHAVDHLKQIGMLKNLDIAVAVVRHSKYNVKYIDPEMRKNIVFIRRVCGENSFVNKIDLPRVIADDIIRIVVICDIRCVFDKK